MAVSVRRGQQIRTLQVSWKVWSQHASHGHTVPDLTLPAHWRVQYQRQITAAIVLELSHWELRSFCTCVAGVLLPRVIIGGGGGGGNIDMFLDNDHFI